MAEVVTLKRKVRAERRRHEIVREEVRIGLEEFTKVIENKFSDTVKDWNTKPEFKVSVKVTKTRWKVEVKIPKTNKIGKIYGWVDKGTGVRGGGKPYEIRPKKSPYLQFDVPHSPVTMPNPPVDGFPPTGDAKTIRAEVIIHPGIYPRNFTKTITTWAKSKEPGAFRSVIEARVKRGFRKITKGVSQ